MLFERRCPRLALHCSALPPPLYLSPSNNLKCPLFRSRPSSLSRVIYLPLTQYSFRYQKLVDSVLELEKAGKGLPLASYFPERYETFSPYYKQYMVCKSTVLYHLIENLIGGKDPMRLALKQLFKSPLLYTAPTLHWPTPGGAAGGDQGHSQGQGTDLSSLGIPPPTPTGSEPPTPMMATPLTRATPRHPDCPPPRMSCSLPISHSPRTYRSPRTCLSPRTYRNRHTYRSLRTFQAHPHPGETVI
jgi:hypothetical protein